MYWIKGTAVNRPSVIWSSVGGEAFYSAMLRSWSFNEPMRLHCELHKSFSVSPHLHVLRWEMVARLGCSQACPLL